MRRLSTLTTQQETGRCDDASPFPPVVYRPGHRPPGAEVGWPGVVLLIARSLKHTWWTTRPQFADHTAPHLYDTHDTPSINIKRGQDLRDTAAQ